MQQECGCDQSHVVAVLPLSLSGRAMASPPAEAATNHRLQLAATNRNFELATTNRKYVCRLGLLV
jgi:hypothetical protein